MGLDRLRTPPQVPPLFNGTPISIVGDAKRLIETSRAVQDQIVQTVQPRVSSFANVLLPLAQAENTMKLESEILGFYKDVSPDPELRHASGEAQKLLNNFAIETSMREDLFQLVDAVLNKNESLDIESQHLLTKQHQQYIRNGLKLPVGPKRDRFKEVQLRLSELQLEFRKNQNEDEGGIWFLPQELEGVPEDFLSSLDKGTEENEGKIFLNFDYPHLMPVLTYAKNGETRRRQFIGHEKKCVTNVPVFRETMLLRDEAARLLGYPNHAAFRIEAKMAKTSEAVNVFLEDLRYRLTTGAETEVANLKLLKKADLKNRGELYDDKLFYWDRQFYHQIMLQTQYSVNQQQIAEYFPLKSTIQGMLNIFQNLFGMDFVEIVGVERDKLGCSGKESDLVWQDDVQVFAVWDDEAQGGGFLGYLYLDLFPRENKYGGAANFNLQPGFIKEDGTRHYPATALVCNFTKPTSKKPSLLKHDEVVMLFHELGHGIHDLVSKTRFARFHGTMTVIDFGEAPSQMLENWCWTPSTLKSLSRHYSTLSPEYLNSWEEHAKGEPQPPEKIPDEMIESLIRAKHVNGALHHLRVLQLSMFDMLVHQPESHESIEKMNVSAEYNRLRRQLMKMDGPEALGEGDEWGHGQANIGHIMNEYDAGLYGYLYSQVFADDMFHTAFRSDPMNTKEGLKYRYTVLEKGGSQDEMITLVEFLGREPRTDAFYKAIGLV